MSDLIHQFGSPALALAAYNAGPAPVQACHCVPSIPETTAYVSRILALLEQGGENDLASALTEADGAWSESDVEEWERAREEAWATWPAGRSSTPTS